jgi:glycosyltransferase involved in cell wall biosynthesis
MSKRVTWLLPVKNGMPFLREALASIEAQTYQDFEVIVWDNGSTDGSAELLTAWIPSRLSGRVVIGQPLSFALSLAKMVELAQTEFCARIDADDINLPERLEIQVNFLDANPGLILVGSDTEYIDAEGSRLDRQHAQPTRDAEIRWKLRWSNCFNHPTILFRRDRVLAAGNYRDSTFADCTPDDYDLWLRCAFRGELANIPLQLVKYRMTSTSVTGGYDQDYRSINDFVAERHADILFPGMAATEALAFRRKFDPGSEAAVTPSDLTLLVSVAKATACGSKQPSHYFMQTRFFLRQIRSVTRRLSQRYLGKKITDVFDRTWLFPGGRG